MLKFYHVIYKLLSTIQILRVKVISILARRACPGDTLSLPDKHPKEERTSLASQNTLTMLENLQSPQSHFYLSSVHRRLTIWTRAKDALDSRLSAGLHLTDGHQESAR